MLHAYTPLGLKPGQILSVFKGNIILERLLPFMEETEMEKVTEYSFVLARLLEYVVEILKVRKADIITRHTDQRRRIKERNDIIKANEKIDKERKKALTRAKAIHAGKKVPEEGEEEEKEEKEEGNEEEEEGENEEEEDEEKDKEEEQQQEAQIEGDKEPFNEAAFLELFDQEHPKQAVPDEVVIDLDEDFDIEEERQGGNEENEEEDEEGGDAQKEEEE